MLRIQTIYFFTRNAHRDQIRSE